MDNKYSEIQQQIEDTQSDLNDKLEELEHQITGTYKSVKDSVNTVRDNLNIKLHVRRRPWTLVAGAAALGFLGGFRSQRCGNGHTTHNDKSTRVPMANVAAATAKICKNGANGAQPDTVAEPGRLSNLGEKLQPEMSALKGIVVRALFGVIRVIVTKQASNFMAQPVDDKNNGYNRKYR